MKHLLLFLLLPLTLISQVQFDDLMEINSLNDFKKVVIENNYTATRDQPFSSFLFYGKGKKSLENYDWYCHSATYNLTDSTFSFGFELDDNCLFLSSSLSSEKYSRCPYLPLIEEIKNQCEYEAILNYDGEDYVTYKCADSKFGGLLGIMTAFGRGNIRSFNID